MHASLPREGRQSILEVIAQLLQRNSMAPAGSLAENPIVPIEDLRAARELRALISHGPDEAYLLLRRMAALGVDPDELARIEPAVFRTLHARCTICDYHGRCGWDLADDLDPSWKEPQNNWQSYCPNVRELCALLEMPWFRSGSGTASP